MNRNLYIEMCNEIINDDTFNEIDEKLSILNKETVDWIKQKMLFHISEAYERGTKNKK